MELSLDVLEEVVAALKDGRLDDKLLRRAAREPYLLSPVYRNVETLWTVRATNVVWSADLQEAAWNDGGELLTTTRKSTRGNGTDLRPIRFDLGETRLICRGNKNLVVIDKETGFTITRRDDATDGVYVRDESLFAWRTALGDVFLGGKHVGRFDPSAQMTAAGGRLYIQDSAEGMWIDDHRVGRDLRLKISPDGKRALCVGVDPTGEAGKERTLLLNGEPWFTCQRDQKIISFGFFNDNTPYVVDRTECDVVLTVVDGVVPLYTTPTRTSTQEEERVKIRGQSKDGPFVMVQTTAEYGQLTIIPRRNVGQLCVGRMKKVCEIVALPDGTFACTVVRDDDKHTYLRVGNGGAKQVGPFYRHLERLTVSPNGRRIAAVARQKGDPAQQFVVVDGHAGRLHREVLAMMFADENTLRYVAKDYPDGVVSTSAYEVTLA